MANSIEELLNRKISTVKELKDAIKDLQNSLIGLDAESEEFKQTSQQLAAAQAELNKVTKAGTADNTAAKDSIVGLERSYRDLYNQYKLLSEEQRNSPFGKEMAKQLEEMSTKLNDTKKEVGNFTQNIGHYAEGAVEAFQKMGISVGGLQKPLSAANGGMKAFNTTLKANPILAVVAAVLALVNILKKGVEAIHKNEESQMRLNEAMASFRPIIDAVSNAFDKLGQFIVTVIGWLGKAVDGIRTAKAAFTDFIGITKNAKEELKQQQALYQDIAKSQNALTKAKREAQKENAKKSADVERLREEAAETTNVIEKKKKLEEAKRIQAEIDAENIRLAEEELRVLQEQSEATANDAEENDRLAQALANVANAQAQAASNARRFTREIKAAGRASGNASDDQKKKAKELLKTLEEANRTEIQNIEIKYKEEKKLLEKYGLDTSLLTKKYNKDVMDATLSARIKYLENYRKSLSEENRIYNQYQKDRIENLELNKRYDPIGATDEEIKIFGREIKELDKGYRRIAEIRHQFMLTLNPEDYEDELEYLRQFNIVMSQPVENLDGSLLEAKNLMLELSEKTGESIETFEQLENIITKLGQTTVDLDLDNIIQKFNDELGNIIPAWLSSSQEEIDEIANEFRLEGISEDIIEKFKKHSKDYFTYIIDEWDRYIKIAQEKFEGLNWNNPFTKLFAANNLNFSYEPIIDDAKHFLSTYDLLIEEFNKRQAENTRKELEAVESTISTLQEKINENPQDKVLLEQLSEFTKRRREIQAEMIDNIIALEELAAERIKNIWDSSLDAFGNVTSSMSSMINTYQNLIQAEVQEGKISKKEAEKKIKTLKNLEKIQLAVSIANIAGSTAAGLMDIWRSYAGEKVANAQTAAATGPAAAVTVAALNAKSLTSAILNSVGLLAAAGAQIAAAKGNYISNMSGFESISSGGGSETVSATATPTIDSSVYSYSQERQSIEMEQLMNRPIWVSVSDISDGLGQQVKVTQESSF